MRLLQVCDGPLHNRQPACLYHVLNDDVDKSQWRRDLAVKLDHPVVKQDGGIFCLLTIITYSGCLCLPQALSFGQGGARAQVRECEAWTAREDDLFLVSRLSTGGLADIVSPLLQHSSSKQSPMRDMRGESQE
jgi:hypothetical protein